MPNRSTPARMLAPLAALAMAGPLAAEAPQSVATYLGRIARIDAAGPRLRSVIALNPAAAAEQAKLAKSTAPLAGRAVLIKDNIETADAMPTTAGSLALSTNFTHRDAPLVARLRQAGAVILGKTNLSEWANIRSSYSTSGWSAVGGQTRNPFALDRTPCGSSAGSGAAVAAHLAWAAIGTETDGSITCPASVNGVVGFKPTVGLVSRTYVVPISHSQDTPGPMAQSVADAALLLNALAGSDPADPATLEADQHKSDFAAGLASASLKGVRIGVLSKQVGDDRGVIALFDRALADLKAAGAVLVPIDYSPDEAMFKAEATVLHGELHRDLDAYLAALPGQPPVRSLVDVIAFNSAHAPTELRWFGQETFIASAAQTDDAAVAAARATSLRLAGAEGIERLLAANTVSLLVAPTEGPAWPIDYITHAGGLDGIGLGSLAAIAGTPHLTVPMGAVEGLPVGLSFMGGKWRDAAVLVAGAAYERTRTAKLAEPRFKRWGE